MIRNTKKIISFVLAICIFASSVFCINALDGKLVTKAASVTKTYNDLNDIQKDIYNCLKNFNEYVGIAEAKGVNVDYATQMYTDVINNFPEFYYVSSSFEYTTGFFNRSAITKLYPLYGMSKSEYEASKPVFEQGMQKAKNIVDDSMNDAQKALVIHDYILNNSVYADDELDVAHSAWGFFKNGHIVCAGLALVYSYMLHQVGVKSDYIFSNEMHHAWNAVMVDGQWYYVDLTYDGSTLDNNNPDPYGMGLHRWFLKSESYFYGEKGLVHKNNMSYDYPNDRDDGKRPCGNKYDSYFWDDIGTNILVINGNYYYLEPNYNSGYAKIVRRDKNGNSSYVSTGSFYSSVGTIYLAGGGYTATCKYMYGLISYLEGKLIISTNTAIQAIPVGGGSIQTIDYINNRSSARTNSLYIKNDRVCFKLTGSTQEKSFNKMNYFRDHISTRSNGYNMFYYCDVDNNNHINAKDYLLIKQQNKAW